MAHPNSICWLTHRPTKLEQQHFETLWHNLTAHGYHVQWVQVPEQGFDTLPMWLYQNIGEETGSIFYGGTDLAWFGRVLNAVRSLPYPEKNCLPFFWIHEEVDRHRMDEMVAEGFSDFIHNNISILELKARIGLRFREFELAQNRELERRAEKAKQARDEIVLKQREEFLGVCAHDLRSPLGLIQSSARMILDNHSGKSTLNPTETELLHRMKRQAGHALTLVKDLLDVMSFEQGFRPQYQLIHLHEMLNEFYKDFKVQADAKKILFHYRNTVPSYRVLADSERLRQLLNNLFANALKFTAEGKNIFLEVTPFKGRRKSDPEYPMVVISLRDEGKGMGQRELQNVFDRFTAIKNHSNPEGRGLGLTVAKQISLLHEGNVWVESAEGKGSTFYALFPHVISRTQGRTPGEAAQITETRLLVAEPNEDRRTQFYEPFNRDGVKISYAKDGVDALAMLFHMLPDAVILPPELTKMDVMEVVRIAKSEALTSTIPLFLAAEEKQKAENFVDPHKFDRSVKLPMSEETFQTTLTSVGKTPAIRKKAA